MWPCGARAKRSFVAVRVSLGRQWGVNVGVTRESANACVERAFRRLARKVGERTWVLVGLGQVHPDKGGSESDPERPHAAQDE